ncbi:MAG: hypothetical protein ABIN91_05495, partial [Mucilaginibacter sp.]|uniref:hypothetical protein n=1 Tax=Mucilaginibacter sp. TaxID=1882438 RepID=UPI0032671E11
YIRSASGINSAVYNIAITKAGSAVISALAIAAATNVTDNNGILFGSSAPTGWDGKVLFTKKLALGTDGHIMQQYMGGAHDTIITFKENNLSEVYTANTYKAGLQISSATPHYVFNNGTYTTTSITFALYDYLRIKVVGTAITVEKSSNGTSWTTVYTFAYTRTTDLYIGMSVYGVSKVYGAKGFNLI